MLCARFCLPWWGVLQSAADISAAPAVHTTSIVLTPDESTVCAVNQDSGTIGLWSWTGTGPVREIPVGEEPRTLAVSADGRRVYVTNQRSQTLSMVDLQAGKTVADIAVGGQPYGVVVTPDGKGAFVSQYAGAYLAQKYCPGAIAAVDLAAGKVTGRVAVKPRPWAMALSADGRWLYVTHFLQGDGKGIVTQIEAPTLTVAREIALNEDDGVRDGRGGVFNALAAIALHPVGRRAVVAGMHANIRRGLTLDGQPLSHKTTVQAALRVLDLEVGQELPGARMLSSFNGQAVAVPSAVAWLGSGEHFIDVYFASSDFKVIQYNEQGVVAERALRAVPPGPTGVAVTRDGRTAFFNCRWDRSVAQFSLATVRDPVLVKTVRLTAEPWEKQRLEGALLFHNTRDSRMTANRWMSCGVCHLDGGLIADGLVWDLTIKGEPPKFSNTMDLVLTPGTTPPFFHRGASDFVAAEERFVRVFSAGAGFLNRGDPTSEASAGALAANEPRAGTGPSMSAEWAAVLAFINALRPRPNPHLEGNLPRAEIRDAARRGRRLFFDDNIGCGHCHRGPRLTISGRSGPPALFDVGTGKRLDVPSLLHLWDTAPYLHDGRAKTLHDFFTKHNPEDRHGKTSHLSASQLDDLVAFLLAPHGEMEQR